VKIIEAMKKVKMNQVKIKDLQEKIKQNCANLSIETPQYGADTKKKISEWAQSCHDLSQENIRLLVAIQRTNLVTTVTIEVGGKPVTHSISEWVWRRREYAATDLATYQAMNDRNLKESFINPTVQGAEPTKVTVVRFFDPVERDEKVVEYREEPFRIDSALEVVNATTELVE
jgi:hypothetical protein